MGSASLQFQLPAELRADTAWLAVLHLLERAFPDDPRVWQHVHARSSSIDFDTMIREGAWSGGERRLLKATAAMFDGEHTTNLWDLAGTLDTGRWTLFLEALGILRGDENQE
jgi:hypothetical protein